MYKQSCQDLEIFPFVPAATFSPALLDPSNENLRLCLQPSPPPPLQDKPHSVHLRKEFFGGRHNQSDSVTVAIIVKKKV